MVWTKINFFEIKYFIKICNLCYSLDYPSSQPSFGFTDFKFSVVFIRSIYEGKISLDKVKMSLIKMNGIFDNVKKWCSDKLNCLW